MTLFFRRNMKDSLSQKIHIKTTFLGLLEKTIFILENIVFLLQEKLKMIKNLILCKSPNDYLYFYGDP